MIREWCRYIPGSHFSDGKIEIAAFGQTFSLSLSASVHLHEALGKALEEAKKTEPRALAWLRGDKS